MSRTLVGDKNDTGVVISLSTLLLVWIFLGMFLLELASGGGGLFLSLGLWVGAFPFFWASVQQLFIEIKWVDPTYLVPGT